MSRAKKRHRTSQLHQNTSAGLSHAHAGHRGDTHEKKIGLKKKTGIKEIAIVVEKKSHGSPKEARKGKEGRKQLLAQGFFALVFVVRGFPFRV